MRSFVYKSFVNQSTLQMLVVFLGCSFYPVRYRGVEAGMLAEECQGNAAWAGDGLEQPSRIWKAFLLKNLSYVVHFINLILNWAPELFFYVYVSGGV